MTSFCSPGQMIWEIMDCWVAGWVLCKLFKFLQTYSITSSNYMILALSVERHRFQPFYIFCISCISSLSSSIVLSRAYTVYCTAMYYSKQHQYQFTNQYFVLFYCQDQVRSPKVQSPKVKTKGTWADTKITRLA